MVRTQIQSVNPWASLLLFIGNLIFWRLKSQKSISSSRRRQSKGFHNTSFDLAITFCAHRTIFIPGLDQSKSLIWRSVASLLHAIRGGEVLLKINFLGLLATLKVHAITKSTGFNRQFRMMLIILPRAASHLDSAFKMYLWAAMKSTWIPIDSIVHNSALESKKWSNKNQIKVDRNRREHTALQRILPIISFHSRCNIMLGCGPLSAGRFQFWLKPMSTPPMIESQWH